MFHVIFPETWNQNDIVNHFRKYGAVFIRWVDSSSAFVSLMNRENAPILLKTIGTTKGVKVSTFSTYRRVTGADIEEVYSYQRLFLFVCFITENLIFFLLLISQIG